jgi:hypothetical protein
MGGLVFGNYGNSLEIMGGESHGYPNVAPGGVNFYSMHWDFQGTLINNTYSGTFVAIINYSTTSADTVNHDIYQQELWRTGVFSTTLK